MEVHYFRGKYPNFGDDLNASLWTHVLPHDVLDQQDILLFGVGSILNEERISAYAGDPRRKAILGSGTSYGAPPSNLSDWHVHAVRGPLTASLIGRPGKAVTDAAILVADHADKYGVLRKQGGRIIVIPHHYSIDGARWAEAADRAGMTYVNPRSTVPEILSYIGQADLVITEAMHGAILSDTLRVPWIPISCSPDFDPFKWRDWALSMDLDFSPSRIAPSSAQKALSYWRKARSGPTYPPLPDRLDPDHPATQAMLADHLQSRYQKPGRQSGGQSRSAGAASHRMV